MRHIHDGNFNGPLDLLLQLIEQQELDITQVSLAKVTEQYITELQKLEELPMDELSEFLVVAAKLLLIKSRLMVPGESGPEDEAALDLERQLKMYKAFVDAAKDIGKMWNRHRVSYARDGYAAMEPIFNPPPHATPDALQALFHDILQDLEPIVHLPETVIIRTINIREKIGQIMERLNNGTSTSFHDLLSQATTKTEVVVTFLALLEMVKLRSVTLAQDDPYADMRIETLDAVEPELVTVTSI